MRGQLGLCASKGAFSAGDAHDILLTGPLLNYSRLDASYNSTSLPGPPRETLLSVYLCHSVALDSAMIWCNTPSAMVASLRSRPHCSNTHRRLDWANSSTSSHTPAPRTRTPMNSHTRTLSTCCLSPLGTVHRRCAVSSTCRLTEKYGRSTARVPLFVFHWPAPTGLSAICHLSHARVWEYNIRQWPTVARHAASGAWLKFQRRPNRIRPA